MATTIGQAVRIFINFYILTSHHLLHISSDPALAPNLVVAFQLKKWVQRILLVLLFSLGPRPFLAVAVFNFRRLTRLTLKVLSNTVLQILLELSGVLVAVNEGLGAMSLHFALLELSFVGCAVVVRKDALAVRDVVHELALIK